jgi:two-component system sensor histidine kinase TctE
VNAVRARSLKRHFQHTLAGGALACIALAGVLRWQQVQALQGERQDARLVSQVGEATPDVPFARVSRLTGERVAGEAGLPFYPWPSELRAGAAPSLYYAQVRGQLVRAAAVLQPATGGEPLVRQVAAPAAERMPALAHFATGPFPGFAAGVLAMLVIAAAAAWAARRWVVRTLQSFAANEAPPAPAELAPALGRLRELHAGERLWVEQQRRFLADAAHQLRTPMAVLRTQLQAALQSPGDPRETLAAMLHTVDRATGLANQLLSVTRIEQLQRSGGLRAIAVAPVVREAVVELSPLLARKRLDFALEGEDFEATADPVMLGELLRNLLANAIHHSTAGGRMGVVLRGALPAREIVVWDEGPGIADHVKPRLFTPFSAGQGGVGLGLSICQQIGEAMAARVQLFDRLEGGRVIGVDAVVAWDAAA